MAKTPKKHFFGKFMKITFGPLKDPIFYENDNDFVCRCSL